MADSLADDEYFAGLSSSQLEIKDIEWPPTPEENRKIAAEKRLEAIREALKETKEILTPAQRRLKIIQDALESSHSSGNKRSAESDSKDSVFPSIAAKKLRPALNNSKLARVFLSREQQHILQVVEKGFSIFFTGSAGT